MVDQIIFVVVLDKPVCQELVVNLGLIKVFLGRIVALIMVEHSLLKAN